MSDILIKNLRFAYTNTVNHRAGNIIENMSLCIEKGKTVGIIGANGAGKSTLFRIMTGLLPDYEGEVKICGLDVCKKNMVNVRKKLGYVFQESDNQLFMANVKDNLAFGPRNYGKGKEETEYLVKEVLQSVGIEELYDRQVSRLSGGEKKLVSIAAILAMEPEIVLMDEPSICLDPKNRRRLIHVLNHIPKTKLIASHDLDLILDTCERTILISDGKTVKDGLTKEILSDKVLLEENNLELPLCMQGFV